MNVHRLWANKKLSTPLVSDSISLNFSSRSAALMIDKLPTLSERYEGYLIPAGRKQRRCLKVKESHITVPCICCLPFPSLFYIIRFTIFLQLLYFLVRHCTVYNFFFSSMLSESSDNDFSFLFTPIYFVATQKKSQLKLNIVYRLLIW
jgi:hypothetical protein